MRRPFQASLFAVSLAALLVAALPARAAPDVDALVTYETRQVTSNGVTRTETWQERLVRRGDTVWTERVLPARSAASHDEHTGHKHFDFDAAARWVQRDASGAPRLRYVDREHRVVVEVPKAEYAAVGFDGSWDAAAHLVPPKAIEAMKPAGHRGWRASQSAGWSHRVQWSEKAGLPLRVESTRDDGGARRVVTVLPSSAVNIRAVPWSGLTGYTQKEYDDFMD